MANDNIVAELSEEHKKYISGSEEVMKFSMEIIYLILKEQGMNIDIFGRTKSEASILNNVMQINKKIDGEYIDINAMSIIGEDPLRMVKILDNYTYNGINVFERTIKSDSNYIDEVDENDNVIVKRSKDNGYSAYHATRKINPLFIRSIVKNIIYKLDYVGESDLSELEKKFVEIYDRC